MITRRNKRDYHCLSFFSTLDLSSDDSVDFDLS